MVSMSIACYYLEKDQPFALPTSLDTRLCIGSFETLHSRNVSVMLVVSALL